MSTDIKPPKSHHSEMTIANSSVYFLCGEGWWEKRVSFYLGFSSYMYMYSEHIRIYIFICHYHTYQHGENVFILTANTTIHVKERRNLEKIKSC